MQCCWFALFIGATLKLCFNSTQLTIKENTIFIRYGLLGNGQTNHTKNQCSTKQSRISMDSIWNLIDYTYYERHESLHSQQTGVEQSSWRQLIIVIGNIQTERSIVYAFFFSGGQCTEAFESVNVFVVDSDDKHTKWDSEQVREREKKITITNDIKSAVINISFPQNQLTTEIGFADSANVTQYFYLRKCHSRGFGRFWQIANRISLLGHFFSFLSKTKNAYHLQISHWW